MDFTGEFLYCREDPLVMPWLSPSLKGTHKCSSVRVSLVCVEGGRKSLGYFSFTKNKEEQPRLDLPLFKNHNHGKIPNL